jgi:hypothetical protein
MCAAPTSEAKPSQESWSAAELIKAGWRETDLVWERVCARRLEHLSKDDTQAASEDSAEALRLARASFAADDPRLGTSLANHAHTLRAAGKGAAADDLLKEAQTVWSRSPAWIAAMTAPRVARSSMFHMRMEQRHRDTYEERWQGKWQELADEVQKKLSVMNSENRKEDAGAALARWRRECPAMLNDTRKLMAAAILLA